MKYKINREHVEGLFSELYEKWPHCNFLITYSNYNKGLETNLSLDHLVKNILNTKYHIQLGFYTKEMKGFLEKRKIRLKNEEAAFRETLSGWGLIIFNIKNEENSFEIDCGVNSEKRADAWYSIHPELKEPKLWDWNVVRSTNRSMNRIIKKFAS